MVAPGSTGASFDVLLQFSLDPAAQERVQKGASTITEELQKAEKQALKTGKAINQMGSFPGDKLGADFAEFNKQLDQSAHKSENASKKQKELAEATKHAAHEAHLQGMVFKEESMLLSSQAALLTKQSGELARISSRLSQYSRIGLVAGTAVVGGILAEANRFAKEADDAGKATKATQEWTAATRELGQARSKVDAVLLKEALPLLQQVARVANQAADIVDKHPEIASFALKAGVLVAGLSALGLLVSKGIQLRSDQLYLAAVPIQLKSSELMFAASEQMLVAAKLQAEAHGTEITSGLGGKAAGAGGLAAGLTSTPALIAEALAFVAVSIKIADQLKAIDDQAVKLAKSGSQYAFVLKAVENVFEAAIGTINPLVPAVKNLKESWERDVPAIVKLIQRLIGAADNGGHGGSTGGRTPQTDAIPRITTETLEQAAKIYADYKSEDLALVQKHYADRQNIIDDALAQEKSADQKYAQSVAKINSNTTSSLANAANDFAKANERAEQQYQDQRSQIIRDGNDQIEKIEQESKERLRKLTQDHNDRVADLTASRDALGLSKENRQFNQAKAEERRQTQLEIKQRRQDIAQRLADLAHSYEQERAQRQADYQERVAEIHANAAQQLKEVETEHAAELQQIQQQKAAKLRELDAQFLAERQRRYQYFLAQIRDVDAALLGETKIRQQYQQKMLQDVIAWAEQYRSAAANAFPSAPTSTTGRAYGGYASYGMYKLGDNPSGGAGPDEYVIKGISTKALEQAVGGKINDQILLNAVRAFVGGGATTYVDQRRIDQAAPAWSKREMQNIAEDTLRKLIRRD